MSDLDDTIGVEEDKSRRASGTLSVRVAGSGIFLVHPLPADGSVLIGRTGDADLRIDDPSVSRRHAQLLISKGPRVEVEDLGSQNGTSVAGRKLPAGERAEVFPGEAIDVGSVTLILQPNSAQSRPRRIWTHGYFEARLEEECARAVERGGRFAVARLHLHGTSRARDVEELLARTVRSTDILASYGPGELEVLFLDTSPKDAAEHLRKEILPVLGGERAAAVGLACFPRDGRTPETLMAKACAEARDEPGPSSRMNAPIIIADEAMKRLHRLLERVAQGTISVLLLGETGVGKEALAEAVHRASERRERPLLRLNSSALNETLLESELFGHEKGAFTSADSAKAGLLETAEGGTVFLDEIGELPPSIQAKLLRVLEDRQVLRVGALKARPIDVRFISATNRDLEKEVERGTFRRDLYFRLNGFSVVIPPLRERISEIEPLAKNFLKDAWRAGGRSGEAHLSEDAMLWLLRYHWPGNIRELRNVIERAALLADGEEIGLDELPTEKMSTVVAEAPAPRRTGVSADSAEPRLKSELEAVEKQRILDVLEQCAGNQTRAARMLGISRNTLAARIESYGLPRPRKPAGK